MQALVYVTIDFIIVDLPAIKKMAIGSGDFFDSRLPAQPEVFVHINKKTAAPFAL